ncbi:MAG: ribonuclease catalytic domain-containing protein [Thermodesulfobacteriota bacterium]
MSDLVKYPGPGCIVEFLQGNRPHVAWVLEESAGRCRLYTLNKRETKLPAARLLPWAGPCYDPAASRSVMDERLAAHDLRRQELAGAVDPMAVWELAQGELDRARAEWFAGLIWDSPDADRVSAMGRALLEHKTHFKFNPPDFEVHPADKVEARLAEQEIVRERERVITGGQAFLTALWESWSRRQRPPAPPADADLAERLKDAIFAAMAERPDPEAQALWKSLTKGLPDTPFLALHLAQAWGLVGEHHNVHLEVEGYAWGDAWAAEHGVDLAGVRTRFGELRRPAEATPFVSVDSATTRDIDDAFVVERDGDGYRMSLALACPALDWPFGSGLDAEVRERASSIYLPEGTSHMLPEELGLGLFSLRAGEERPALVLDFALDGAGAVTSVSPREAWVRVAENSTYEKVEESLGSAAPDPGLAAAFELAEKLRAARIAAGAVVVERPDPKIVLREENGRTSVDIEDSPENARAQLVVSEFMILGNAAVGAWARDAGLPLLYRTQDVTLPGDAAGVWSAPEEAYRVVRLAGCTLLEPEARPHACLGAPAYSPVTSPLRRYPDLMNQAQVLSWLRRGHPLWSREDLIRLLPVVTARVEAAGRIQRYRTRYWKLEYFRQRKDQTFSAVVVEDGPFVSATLPREQFFVRAPRDVFGEKVYPGQRFAVRLGKANPLLNEIRVMEAVEE